MNLANVYKIAVGLGAGSGVAAHGGSGALFIDDIELLRPSDQRLPQRGKLPETVIEGISGPAAVGPAQTPNQFSIIVFKRKPA